MKKVRNKNSFPSNKTNHRNSQSNVFSFTIGRPLDGRKAGTLKISIFNSKYIQNGRIQFSFRTDLPRSADARRIQIIS